MIRMCISLWMACSFGNIFLEAHPSSFSTNSFFPCRHCDQHWALGIDHDCNILELEDGSQWKIAEADSEELISWGHGDYVQISPHYFSSSHEYYITNQDNESYVRANLVNAPHRDSPYAVTITGTSYRQSFYLSNGSCWKISSSDFLVVRNWCIDDLVIIGTNNEWFSSYTHILINIHTNTFVRVQRI